MSLSRPSRIANDPSQANKFPEGEFVLSVGEIRTNTIDRADNTEWLWEPRKERKDGRAQVGNEEHQYLTVQLENGVPINGADDPGGQKIFYKFLAIDGDVGILDADNDQPDLGFEIIRDGDRLVNFALALGQVAEEDGEVTVSDSFVEDLGSGAFEGVQVQCEVTYRSGVFNDRAWEKQYLKFGAVEG